MKKQIIYMLCATALLSSCHIYKSYDRPEDILTAGLYRDTVATGDTLASDTANFGNLPWREVFTDPQLQTLIEQGLANNTPSDSHPESRRSKKCANDFTSGLCSFVSTVATGNN